MASPAYATGGFALPISLQSPNAAAFDEFGSDVACSSGSLCFVGIRGADSQGVNAGAVEIFERGANGWSFLQRPNATGLLPGDQLGESVAGNATWIVAGSSRHSTSGPDAGAAFVFKKGTASWTFAQRLVPPAGSIGARFGTAVTMSPVAIAVGAPTAANGGSVVTYKLQSGAWVAVSTLSNPTPATSDRFGDALAITDSWLAVGDPFDDTAAPDAGAVYIFAKTPVDWTYVATLLPLSPQVGQHFGQSVSLSGTRLVAGAYGADTGAYESGRVEIFDLVGSTWSRTASIAPLNPIEGGNFGWDVSLDGSSVAVGAPGAGALSFAGEVQLFSRQADASWLRTGLAVLPSPQSADFLGASVSLSGGQLLAAAPTAHPSQQYRGLVGAADLSADCNANGVPDVFELMNGGLDCDRDGLLDACELNSDGDSLPNDCDGCPNDPNKLSAGACGCGVADTDSDGDGAPNCVDGCPNDPNKLVPGTCGCGVEDSDSDGDGTPNCVDGCPSDPNKLSPGACGCGAADADSDGDGTPSCLDGCPDDPNKLSPGTCGCGVADTDSDGDGTPNCVDGCPSDPNKLSPGACGCGAADADSDGDGTPNCLDGCQDDPNKLSPGTCGCGVADTDSDGDGTPNCVDGCPQDPNKLAPGTCGCGIPDTDSDGDGTPNCHDGCPADPAKTGSGACGCGVADTDSDHDGLADCIDACPDDATNQCGSVLEVPAQYATIQAAIDAVPFGRSAIVRVAAGTYHESFELRSKDVVIEGHPNRTTILSGIGVPRAIGRFTGGEPSSAGLRDLVFRQGTAGEPLGPNDSFKVGGAVYGVNSRAFVVGCRFEQCRSDYGGAVYLANSTAAIENCAFSANEATSEGGAALMYQCSGEVRNCSFSGNRSGFTGAGGGSAFKSVGARVAGEALALEACTIIGGLAAVQGAAVEHFENVSGVRGVLRIVGTSISGNSAAVGASGLHVIGETYCCVLSSGTTICSNAPRNADGPYLVEGSVTVCDCVADVDLDGFVGSSDLSAVLTAWGQFSAPGAIGDVNRDGRVDSVDLGLVLANWGVCASN